MNPSTLNSEMYVTQIHIQNEVKTTKTKKSDNNSITSVKYNGLLSHQDVKEHNSNSEIINVIYENTAADSVRKYGKWFTSKNVYKMEIEDVNEIKEGRKSKSRVSSQKTERQKSSLKTASKKSALPTQLKEMDDIPESKEPEDYPVEPFYPIDQTFLINMLLLTLVMSVITAVFTVYTYNSHYMRDFFHTPMGKVLFMYAMGGILVLNYALMYSSCTRMFPFNLVVSVFAVISMSLVTAYITAFYDTFVIAYALVATAIAVLLCLILALMNFDLTQYMIYLFAIGVAFTALTTIIFFTSVFLGIKYESLQLVFLFSGTLINIVVLIMELQLILGGKSVALGENEYAFGAYMLYTSIIDLFLKLIQIIGFIFEEEDDTF